jgi:hypothetical protein
MADWIGEIVSKIFKFFKKKDDLYKEDKVSVDLTEESGNKITYNERALRREELEEMRGKHFAKIALKLDFNSIIYLAQNKLLNIPSDCSSVTLRYRDIYDNLSEEDKLVFKTDKELVFKNLSDTFSRLGYTTRINSFYDELTIYID